MHAPLKKPMVLTHAGRERLARQLVEVAERQRLLADEAGIEGRLPDQEEYGQLAALTAELREALERAVSPSHVADDPSIVEVGDTVTLAHDDGEVEQLTLTEPIEATATEDNVSILSPLGRALAGRRVGDDVRVAAPAGAYTCLILARRRAS